MAKHLRTILILSIFAALSCRGGVRTPDGASPVERDPADQLTAGASSPAMSLSPQGWVLDSLGYINIADADPDIVIDLKYATPDNFMGEVLYTDLREAFLLPEAVAMLVEAHAELQRLHPGYRFIVYDAARPMSVQRRMRKVAEREGKHFYVADPAKGGGLHNYGAAVDISILDQNGEPLAMGTEYDHFGPEANIDREQGLVEQGAITAREWENRLLLRKVMRSAGFTTVASEWWHFNMCSREQARREYPLIDL